MHVTTNKRDYNIMALDYGNARVGVAVGHSIARIPNPIDALATGDTLFAELDKAIKDNNVQQIVVGMPYAPQGGDTEQTVIVRDFVAKLTEHCNVPVAVVDESMSSVEAEKLIGAKRADKGMIDAYAAAIILQRYFDEEQRVSI